MIGVILLAALDLEAAGRPARPRKPYQFTVRTFFAAAVWLSLLLAAAKMLKNEALATAVLFLAWVAVGELYRRFWAVGPLVALGGGPVLLLVVWAIVLIAFATPTRRDALLPPVSWFLIFAFAWGIAVSLAVVIERAVDRWLAGRASRARSRRAGESSGEPQPARPGSKLRCAAILLAIHTVPALIVLGDSMRTPFLPRPFLRFVVMMVPDLPVVPLYILMPGLDTGPSDLAAYRLFTLASLVVGGAFYFMVGWLVACVVERIDRRRVVQSAAEPSSNESLLTGDGSDA